MRNSEEEDNQEQKLIELVQENAQIKKQLSKGQQNEDPEQMMADLEIKEDIMDQPRKDGLENAKIRK